MPKKQQPRIIIVGFTRPKKPADPTQVMPGIIQEWSSDDIRNVLPQGDEYITHVYMHASLGNPDKYTLKRRFAYKVHDAKSVADLIIKLTALYVITAPQLEALKLLLTEEPNKFELAEEKPHVNWGWHGKRISQWN